MHGQQANGRTIGLGLAGVLGTLVLAAQAQVTPHAGMLRYPDVSATHIVFAYANDLWVAPHDGGLAVPLASPPGAEAFPRFSPDGQTIAFVGNYDGNRDLYTIPRDGGVPTRVTHHPAGESLCDWTPDGRLLYLSNGLAGLPRQAQLFFTSAAGGMPEKLPVPYAGFGALSPDGTWLAYTLHSTDNRTWKRYRGGMATDIWLFNLKDHSSKKITDWEGTDSLPMWHGKLVYYVSDDGAAHRQNIWVYDTATGQREQVTNFTDLDVKWPSIGPGAAGQGEIIFQLGTELRLLDLKTRQTKKIEITIPGARPKLRPQAVDTRGLIAAADISPTGKRAVLEARGDLWTVPAQKGSARDLTRTSGVAERSPAWSPDGKWIAYFGDATGEYELYLAPADGRGETRQLTKDGTCFRYDPNWSPDSKRIVFTDKTGAIWLHTIDTGETKQVDVDEWAERVGASWAPDSNWLVYAKPGDNRLGALWLYRVDTGERHQVTSGRFSDGQPVFDRKGDYIYFTSSRDFSSPIYEDLGTTYAYPNTQVLLAVPLRKDMASPYAPKSDEEEPKKDEKKDEKPAAATQPATASAPAEAAAEAAAVTKPAETQAASAPASQPATDQVEKKDQPKPVVIDLEGFERRALLLPQRRGYFSGLAVNSDGKLLYVRAPARGADGGPAIRIFDIADEKKEEKTVLDGVGAFSISADGKKLLVRRDATMAIVDAAADQKLDKPMPLDGLVATIDPRAEWQQLFNEAWRVQRDFFYDPHMHGIDWPAMRTRFGAMLADCVSREDVGYVISELIAELNVGHAYYFGGDVEPQPSVSVGMLGCDFELDATNGAYRIQRICEGAPWDADARGPLSQPGVDAKVGDYLLALNGVSLDPARDPWAAFQRLAGRTVTLTLSAQPTLDDTARTLVLTLLDSETNLRYRAWIEAKRKYVDEQTGGKVGYIYVPNTGTDGQNDLYRQFYSQIDQAALIIDERWNGGGQIPTRFIELLNRPITNYWARRDGKDWPWPPDAHQGPKCMLINGLAGSGGDAFPAYFRLAKLGKLIGTRTWGGLVGISGNPGLIDGGVTTAPTFAYYKPNGTWGVEGHGVDPDIEVIDDPAKMAEGGDPQLDAAIALMLAEIKEHPYVPPKRPAYPDRRGMGIPESDR